MFGGVLTSRGGAGISVPKLEVAAGTAASGDVNSFLANPIRNLGDGWMEIDLQNAAAISDPTDLVYWEVPIATLLGGAGPLPLEGVVRYEVETDNVEPNGVVLACGVTSSTLATIGTGRAGAACMESNGTGYRARNYYFNGSAWNTANSSSYLASGRRCIGYTEADANDYIRACGCYILDADRAELGAGGRAYNTVGQTTIDQDVAFFGAGWTGVFADTTVKLRCRGVFLTVAELEAAGLK